MKNISHTVFSGAQPSGQMTIGNYLGAIKPWLQLQKKHNCIFCVVDLHALTSGISSNELKKNTLNTYALFLACGLDPEKHTIFVQSQVKEHCELSWILQSLTYMGELNRMTQFKDKSQRYDKNINAGLFTYPSLMAADILLYNADIVPVGDDQKQHLELTRNIAQRLNLKTKDYFNLPKPYILENGSRIMSLQNPAKKMSKSDLNQQSCIFLLDDPKTITKKIKKSVTDSEAIVKADPQRLGINNLVTIYSAFTDTSNEDIALKYYNQGYGVFKADLAEIIISKLKPIQEKFHEISQDPQQIINIMERGAIKAQHIARHNMQIIKDGVGLYG